MRQYIILGMQLVGLRVIPGILQGDKHLIQSTVILATLLIIIDILNGEPFTANK